jgi:hypothetical protein
MSGLLFALDVVAFLIVVLWAYNSEKPGQTGEAGLLGMKGDGEATTPPARVARWKRGPNVAANPATSVTPAAPAPSQSRLDWRRNGAGRPPRA